MASVYLTQQLPYLITPVSVRMDIAETCVILVRWLMCSS